MHFGSCHTLGSGVSHACSGSVRGEGSLPALPAFAVSKAVSPAPGWVSRRGVPARGCLQPGSRARQPVLLTGPGQRRRGCCMLGHVWAKRLLWAGAGGERSSGCIPGRGEVKRLLWAGAGVTRRLRCHRLRPRQAGRGGTAWGAGAGCAACWSVVSAASLLPGACACWLRGLSGSGGRCVWAADSGILTTDRAVGRRSQVARQESAKLRSAVRIRPAPPLLCLRPGSNRYDLGSALS